MLRSAFRHKSSKENNSDEAKSSTSTNLDLNDDEVDFTNQEHSIESDELSFEEATEDFHDCKNEGKTHKDPNKNLLAKMSNPSLDHVLSNEDQENFPYTEREIYEMQLVQLQEQLVAAMIEDQEKNEKLKKYEEINIDKLMEDLKSEKEKNAELTEKNKILKNKSQNQKISRTNASRSDPRKKNNRNSTSSDDWVDVSADFTNDSRQKEEDNEPVTRRPISLESHSSQERETTTKSDLKEGFKDKTDGGPKQIPKKRSRITDFKKRIIDEIVDRLWDFVNEEPDAPSDDQTDEEPLAVKTLKENINRFSHNIKPITRFIKSTRGVFRWENPAASLLAFVFYMFAALRGYLFSLFVLLVIWKLFMNYLHARGIAAHIGLVSKEKDEPSTDDKSWSDKFQLVLQVARKVQNILGDMADSLEKIKNLLTWQHPATRSLFTGLCCLFVASIVLSGPTLFMFIALGMGLKLFITGPLYAKFPKVKQRYDGVAKLWSELPTDAELIPKDAVDNKDNKDAVESTDSPPSPQHNTSTPSGSVSQSWVNVCEKLKIAKTEIALPMWEDGRRCMLMNKDKPLTNLKSGKLYLTHNYLCFERSKSSSSKHFAIPLEDMAYVNKCKPVGILPGTGMAIEVGVKGNEKPYIFGGLMGRDELFDSVIMAGETAGLAWAR